MADIKFIKQPMDCVALLNTEAVFSVEAEGEELTYQWMYSWDNGVNWANLERETATSAELIFMDVADYHNGYLFRCDITDSKANVISSDSVILSVVTILITRQPSSIIVLPNASASFSVEAKGEGLVYQWQYLAPNTTEWVVSGATGRNSPEVSFVANIGLSGFMYRCIITDTNGNSITSEVVLLTVDNSDAFLIKPSTLSDISSAICEATGETITMKPTEMAARIRESFVALSVEQIDEIYNAAINSTTSIV